MANTNNNRKTRQSSVKKKNKINKENKFNKKSVDIFMMILSIIIFIFLISNRTGSLGKIITNNFNNIFGIVSYFIPIVLFVSFFLSFTDRFLKNIKSIILFYLILLFTILLLSSRFLGANLAITFSNIQKNILASGGILGGILAFYLIKLIGIVGSLIIYIGLWITFIVGISKYSYKEFFLAVKNIAIKIAKTIINLFLALKVKISEKNKDKVLNDKSKIEEEDFSTSEKKEEGNLFSDTKKRDFFEEDFKQAEIHEYKSKQVDFGDFDESFKREYDNYNYPSIGLLDGRDEIHETDNEDIKIKAKEIEETLDSFGIKSKVVQINVGPTVTCYELQPARGVKVSRILNLSDDLSLSLATSDIRIEAPIPGKSHVGIEVPNKNKQVVGFKEMITSSEYMNAKSKIPFVLGKSISGDPIVYGIEKTPHLLVSGATGSGKSVCINTIIMSILYKHSPDEVKLLMIDPKVVELSIYNGIAHLIMPVITDPKKAASSLFWAISEMERRYKLFEENHVRDISSYRDIQAIDDTIEKLPFVVIIIDELADLMMTAAGEVEDYITRLAQKSRACGIHLIIATQRPTVDVITGTIKANIPSRIAFAVSSQIDSRTILDMAGAEKLLGKGDMLFAPSDAMKPLRIQGAFVSDAEVLRVVTAIKETRTSEYNEEAIEKVEEKTQVVESGDEDELLSEAIEIIVSEQTASVSLLQRKLKIGYARAGRIIDQLEQRGVIGGYEGSKPRKVLVDRTYLEGE